VVLSNSVFKKCDVKRTKWKQKERNGSSGNQQKAWGYLAAKSFSKCFSWIEHRKKKKKQGCCECYLLQLMYLHCLGSMLVSFFFLRGN